MRAGTLRHRIVIQTPTGSKTATGRPNRSWATFATRWASVSPVSGSESQNVDGLEGRVTHEVRLRYLAGVTPKMRVSHDSRTLEILGVRNGRNERDRELILECREVVS